MSKKALKYAVIPEPQHFETVDEQPVFFLTANVRLENNSGVADVFDCFCEFLLKAFDITPRQTGECIRLEKDADISAEGYKLEVTEDLVQIKASDAAGFFYGLQTLSQLLVSGEKELCEMTVEDYPRFSERGFMLDVARHFFTVDAVKLFIDAMAAMKLNRLHLHLTDDQGWRVEIRKYPLLTMIGSERSHTDFNNVPHRGFYAQDEIRDIVSYAHKRYIHVVPEIAMPGHTVSALASYPKLSCFGRKLQTATHTGAQHDLLCAGKAFTYKFVFEVLDEVISLFPDGELHIGGSEAVKKRWELCDDCQHMIEQNNLQDEDGLQAFFIDRIRRHYEGRGIRIFMWADACNTESYDSSIALQCRNGAEAADFLNSGRQTVISCSDAYYLDSPHALTSLRKTYEYEPMTTEIDEDKAQLMLGVEGVLWTGNVSTMEKAGASAFPRLAAISETAWTSGERKNYVDFAAKVPCLEKYLEIISMPFTKLKEANPVGVKKCASLVCWQSRQLPWQRLYNYIDDHRVEKAAEKKGKC